MRRAAVTSVKVPAGTLNILLHYNQSMGSCHSLKFKVQGGNIYLSKLKLHAYNWSPLRWGKSGSGLLSLSFIYLKLELLLLFKVLTPSEQVGRRAECLRSNWISLLSCVHPCGQVVELQIKSSLQNTWLHLLTDPEVGGNSFASPLPHLSTSLCLMQ